MLRRAALLLAISCAACSEELADPGKAVLTSGQEPDVWAVEPPPTQAIVEKEDESGTRTEIGSYDVPLESFSLGRGAAGRFVVNGYDASGAALVRGRTLPASPAGLSASRLPIFVSRTGEFARPPRNFTTDQGERPPFGIMGGRYLALFGGQEGDQVDVDGYDFGAWTPIVPKGSIGCPSPPCRFESVAIIVTRAIAVGSDYAIWFDLDDASVGSGDVDLPKGLASWADIAGGKTVMADDGTAYIVGATRKSSATAAVVRINTDYSIDAMTLAAPRAEAAAAWVSGRGLLVVGGSDDGIAAGVELLADGNNAFVTQPYVADSTRGAALVPWGDSSALRVGGKDKTGAFAPTVTFSLACGVDCPLAPLGAPVELASVDGFRVESDPEKPAVLLVGDNASGETAAVRFDGATAKPISLRDPRKGAEATRAPSGHVAIFGGVHTDGSFASSLELYIE